MATKKKGSRGNDFDWDSDLDLDIPDFGDGGDSSATTDDRKPITKGIKSVFSGFGKSFASEARLRKTLAKALPREYQEPISKAFEIKNGVRDLYHITGTEISETVKESKRSINRIARNLESTLPRGLYEKVMRWTSESDGGYQAPSKQEIEQGTIDNAISSMLSDTAAVDASNRQQDDARQVIQATIDKKRHADLTTILGSVDQSLISMNTFQEKVGTNFMKKSLEMQFRSYFVQNDMLQLQTKYFQAFKDDLAAITKNTGLPDYVKKATKEALMERLREKTFDSLASSISSRRSQWLNGVVKKAGDKIKEVGANVRDAGSQVLDTVEQVSGMANSGMGPTGSEMFGDVVGGFAGGKLQDWMAKKINDAVKDNPEMIKRGNQLTMLFRNLPQWVGKQVDEGKYAHRIPDALKDILRPETESGSINLNREVDLERAAQFSDKNSRSLNVVIPELLDKIRVSVDALRGDTSTGSLTYDHEMGKFVSKEDRLKGLAETVVSKKTTERTRREVDEIFKRLDPDGTKFDATTRDAISEKLYEANKRGDYFDAEGMQKAADNPDFAKAIRSHIASDASGVKEMRLASAFGDLGARNGEVKDLIQDLINSGRHGELAELGLIDPKTKRINMAMVRKMELGIGSGGQPPTPPSPSPTPGPTPSPTPPPPPGPNTVASALGNIFSGGKVKAFAKGGAFTNTIVDEPTTFDMPGKDTGLMGEAGPEAIMPLSRDEQGRLGVKAEGKSEKILIEIRDILKKMEEKGFGTGMTPEMLEQYFSGKAGKLGSFAKGAFGHAKDFVKGGFSRSWDASAKVLGWGKDAAVGTAKWLSEKKQKFDLYVEGEVEPRLSKAKMEAGRYVDATTGKVITSFEDIKGAVRDLDTGEIALKADELKKAVLKNLESGKSIAVSGLTWGKNAIASLYKGATDSIRGLFGAGKTIYGTGFDLLKKAYKALTDGPMDVYLKDKYDTPVLLKRTMSAGLYFNKDDLSTITKVSEIKGAVVDNDENVVLTKEELANGLYDKDGQEIKTGFDRVAQFVGGSIKKSLNMYKGILNKGLEMGGNAVDWVKSLFSGKSPIMMTTKTTNDILEAIYTLLNNRLPGEKSPDLSDVLPKENAGGPGGISKAKSAIAKFFSRSKDKVDELTEELPDKARAKVEELKEQAKVKTEEIKEKVKEVNEKHIDPLKEKVTEKKARLTQEAAVRLEELKKKAAAKIEEVDEKLHVDERVGKAKRHARDFMGDVFDTADKAVDKARSTKDTIVEKAKALKEDPEGHGEALGKKVRQGATDAKEKASEGWHQLYDLIAERLPKPEKKQFGDTDGDGIRDGSIDDLRAKRKKMVEDAKEKAADVGKKVKGVNPYEAIANFFKEKKEKEEEDDGLGLDDAADALDGAGGGGSEEDKKKARDAKRKRRLARARGNRPQGRIGKMMSGAGRMLKKIPGVNTIAKMGSAVGNSTAGKVIGKGAGLLGRGALGLGRLGLGAAGLLVGGGLSSASILTGGLSMLGSALGMAGTAVGAILSSPVLIPALAVAAVGTAGYFAYKWLTKPDPQPLEKVRLVQYGFRANDIDNYKRVKQIEQKVAGAVSFNGEKAEFDPKKLNIQDMMKVFDLDPTKEEEARKFVDWFAGRFRPIYLNHRALIKIVASPKPLEDVDDNKVDVKKRYLDQCLFPGDHYSVSTNPNKDKAYLFTTQGSVERQIAESKAEVEKKGDTKPDAKQSLATAPTLAAAAAAKIAEDKRKLEAEKKLDENANPVAKAQNERGSTENRVKTAQMAALTAGGAGAGPGANDPDNPVNAPSGPNGEPAKPKSRLGVKPKTGDAAIVKEEMIKLMPKFGINSINQKAALLGNADHESGFQPISENLNYKAATLMKLWPKRFPTMEAAQKVASQGPEGIANSIYGGRMGNTDPTDGWDYRGRGPFQLTGKSNYAAISKVMGKDIVSDPDKLITDPKASAESALAYWRLNPKLGKLADEGNFDQVRKIINGGTIGAQDAAEKVQQYLNELKSSTSGGSPAVPSAPEPTFVPSPKPTVENNPNMGPTPSSYTAPKPAPAPAPTRSYDQPMASPVRPAQSDTFYQNQSKVNTGDSVDIMNKSKDELVKHTGILERIATGIDSLPERIVAAMGGVEKPSTPAAPTPTPTRTPEAKTMTPPSLAFRRSLAGA